MPQKNFNLPGDIGDLFKSFCRERGLREGSAAGAALLTFIHADPQRRDEMMMELHEWMQARGLSEEPDDDERKAKKTPKKTGKKRPDTRS